MASRTSRTPSRPSSLLPSTSTSTTFSLHIPLILLGRKGFDADLDFGVSRYSTRLDVVRRTLRQFYPELPITVWATVTFDESEEDLRSGKSYLKQGNSREETEKRRSGWARKENDKWETYKTSGAWILRLTPRGSEAGPGVWEGWKESDGLLTGEEQGRKGENIWACPFTLQRFGVDLTCRNSLYKEVKSILHAFEVFSAFEYPEHGSIFKITCTQRCWPRLAFSPGRRLGDVESGWSDASMRSFILMLTGFERELLVLCNPVFLLEYWPISHYLTLRAVRVMRKERKRMWKALRNDQGVSEKRKSKQWERIIKQWIGELEWKDEKAEGRMKILGEEKKAWWASIENMSIVDLLSDMSCTGKRGRRLVISFQITEHEEDTNVGGDFEEKIETDNAQPDATSSSGISPSDANLHAPPTPPASLPPFPSPRATVLQVESLTLPIPILATSPTLFLAYLELLSTILWSAEEHSYDKMRATVKSVRETSAMLHESPLQTFIGVLRVFGTAEDVMSLWESELNPRMKTSALYESKLDSIRLDNSLSHGTESQNPVNERLASAFKSSSTLAKPGSKDDAFAPLLRHLEEQGATEKSLMTSFAERFEQAGGFSVPEQTKLYSLMIAEDDGRMKRTERTNSAGIEKDMCRDGCVG